MIKQLSNIKGFSLLVILIVAISSMSYSQNTPKLKLKEKMYWREATDAYFSNDFSRAMLYFKDLHEKYPKWSTLNFYMGKSLYSYSKHKLDAKPYFETAAKQNYKDALYYLGKMYHLEKNFDKALLNYKLYLEHQEEGSVSVEEVERQQDISARASNMINLPRDIIIKNLGPVVNSEFADYVPLITNDESMLFFTSRRENSTGGKLDPYLKYFEDVYVTYNKPEGWTTPTSIGSSINDERHNACVGLSPEGNILILFQTDKSGLDGDLYWSEFDGYDWSEPVKYDDHINSKNNEFSAAFTSDDQTIYFSSDRPGGFGGRDIYRVTTLPNGNWSAPLNMGPTINSSYNDDSPFIHEDGKTLYFSSEGHNTMGGYDIFKSYLSEENKWSTPENLGSPINTVDDDIYFSISASGKTAFLSSERSGGYGDQDIYEVTMNSEGYPTLKGKILDISDPSNKIKATITLEDFETDKLYGVYRNNIGSGNYILLFNYERKYRLTIEADGYERLETELQFNKPNPEGYLKNFYLKQVSK